MITTQNNKTMATAKVNIILSTPFSYVHFSLPWCSSQQKRFEQVPPCLPKTLGWFNLATLKLVWKKTGIKLVFTHLPLLELLKLVCFLLRFPNKPSISQTEGTLWSTFRCTTAACPTLFSLSLACSRLSVRAEVAKVEGTRKVGRAGQRKKEGGPDWLSRSLEQASLSSAVCPNTTETIFFVRI